MKYLFLITFFISVFNAWAIDRLFRFPTSSENHIVFSYAGDLYRTDKSGLNPIKLTSDIGYEMFAKISPDGNTVAFTGQYDGNTEIYVMPIAGGIPKRLTFTATLDRDEVDDRMGPNNIVIGWKNNEEIIYRSRNESFNPFIGQNYVVNKNGGKSSKLPFAQGSWMSFNQSEDKVAYNEIFREFRAWKNYRGGMADDVFIYDFKKDSVENITNNKAQDIHPMWIGESVFYISDVDRRMNLYEYNSISKSTQQLTFHKEFDIKFPSANGTEIVYENGGYIYSFNTKTKKEAKINISISDDFTNSRNQLVDLKPFIQNINLSPNGKRVAITARGEIINSPVEDGVNYNHTKTSGAHEREATWSPDGTQIAYFSDKNGFDEIYIYNLKSQTKTQLTNEPESFKYNLKWSPDSKKILFTDRNLRLRFVTVETKKIKEIAKNEAGKFRYYNWSPDGKWIVYTLPGHNTVYKIFLHEISSSTSLQVSDDFHESYGAVFSQDNNYLFFVSDRSFKPSYSNSEWNHAYFDMAKIYYIPLKKSAKDLLALENKREIDPEEKESKLEEVYNIKNFQQRTLALNVPAGSYWNLRTAEGKLYYNFKQKGDPKTSLKLYDLSSKKETQIGHYGSYEISASGKKMLINAGAHRYQVLDLPTKATKTSKYINLTGLSFPINKKEEWLAIFIEAHRHFQQFFYADNMHGVDWNAIGEKYRALVPAVNHRADLTYLISEMIAELNVGHAYIGRGDVPKAKRIKMGLLGAAAEKDLSTGYFKIAKILDGENWHATKHSPLGKFGAGVKEGAFITQVNESSVKDLTDIHEALIGQANKIVELSISDFKDGSNPKKVLIKTLASQTDLYYYNWVKEKARRVSEASNGEIGYIHIPNMLSKGLNEFVEHFYPQLNKKALIIDDRGNGGGNVSQQITERLNRTLLMANYSKHTKPGNNPYDMHLGPKTLLIDQYSASDGDLFAYRFKALELGPVIGRRTWGGVVGYFGSYKLIDNGYVVVPEFAHFGLNNDGWIIEGEGVSPTINVNNTPTDEYKGIDAQLDRAIEETLKALKDWKNPLPNVPDFPDKTK